MEGFVLHEYHAALGNLGRVNVSRFENIGFLYLTALVRGVGKRLKWVVVMEIRYLRVWKFGSYRLKIPDSRYLKVQEI